MAAWRELPPAEMAAHLLATPTISDGAWTSEPRLPREKRSDFVRRVLLGETLEAAPETPGCQRGQERRRAQDRNGERGFGKSGGCQRCTTTNAGENERAASSKPSRQELLNGSRGANPRQVFTLPGEA